MTADFTDTGVRQKLDKLAASMPHDIARALYEEALIEEKEMRQRTPVDQGPLRASLVTHKPVFSGRNISVQIEAGGPAAPYALFVHEDTDAYHKVGQAKFIESVIRESRPFLAARIAARVNLERNV